MRKKVAISLFVAAVVLFAAIWIGRVPEPRYKGVPVGTLLDKHPAGRGGLNEAQEAVRELGAKAVPYLVSVLEREPTALHRWYAKVHPRFPARLQKFAAQPKNFNQRRAWAAAALTQAGTNAIPALPVLIKAAQADPFFGTRHNAVGTLAAVAAGTSFEEEAASAVISRTTDANKVLCEHAYSCLGKFTNQMQKIVPILLHGLRNPAVKENALVGLRELGTNAMPIIRERIQNEGYLPMSFEALELELQRGRE